MAILMTILPGDISEMLSFMRLELEPVKLGDGSWDDTLTPCLETNPDLV